MTMLVSLLAYRVLWLEQKIEMYSFIWITLLPNVPLCFLYAAALVGNYLDSSCAVASAACCCRAFVCKGHVYTETVKKKTLIVELSSNGT